jgi:hypothetical protein
MRQKQNIYFALSVGRKPSSTLLLVSLRYWSWLVVWTRGSGESLQMVETHFWCKGACASLPQSHRKYVLHTLLVVVNYVKRNKIGKSDVFRQRKGKIYLSF